jgi:hypothetical protein
MIFTVVIVHMHFDLTSTFRTTYMHIYTYVTTMIFLYKWFMWGSLRLFPQVHLCRSLKYRMANADISKDPVPSVNVVMWRSKCADILMEKVRGKRLNLAYINMVVHALVLQFMLLFQILYHMYITL